MECQAQTAAAAARSPTIRRHLRAVAIAGVLVMAAFSTEASALSPCPSGADDYRELLNLELLGRAPEPVIATFLAIPSFAPEYGLVISQGSEGAHVTVVRFIESVWYGSVEEVSPGLMSHVFSKSKVKVRKQQFFISTELSELLKSLLAKEIARAVATSSYGLDGETYVFTVADGRCAETWSPEKGTRNELLVRTFEEVAGLVKIPAQTLRTASERRLLSKLRAWWAEPPATPDTSLERARGR